MQEKTRTYENNTLVQSTRAYLKKIGLPERDLHDVPDSNLRFPDGGHFRIEIPTINSLDACKSVLEHSEKLGIKINRITETLGIFRHTKQEITEWKRLCDDYGCELIMSPGPRATYDTSATVRTPQGARIGYRLRGQEQLIHAITDLRRASDLGITSFLIYDEGMLNVVSSMRNDGIIPLKTHFKVSAHCGHGNPASINMLMKLGANSINPVRDLSLPMISALRQAVSVPLDIHTDNPAASGGFIRFYEAPEIARIAAPVHLKTGNSALTGHGETTTAQDAKSMIRQAALVLEIMNELAPDLKQSISDNSPTLT